MAMIDGSMLRWSDARQFQVFHAAVHGVAALGGLFFMVLLKRRH